MKYTYNGRKVYLEFEGRGVDCFIISGFYDEEDGLDLTDAELDDLQTNHWLDICEKWSP